MGWYGNRLEDLIGGLKAGIFSPEQAMGEMWKLEDEQRARRQERKAARVGGSAAQFNDLASLATSDDFGSLDELAAPFQGTQTQYGASMLPQHQAGLEGLLSSQYLPARDPADQTGFVGNSGLSRTNPTLPASYSVAIGQNIAEDLAAGTSAQEVRANIHTFMQSQFGPNSYSRLAPQIDAEISKHLKYGTGRGF
jgi:hypothetical protein